jgi:CubicO group peptidase (beta-lactamase class C family)
MTSNINLLQKYSQAISIIDACVSYRVKKDHIPTLAIGISYKNETILNKIYSSAETKPSIEAAFKIASITKIFTTIAILQLVEQQQITLNVPVSTYLPWFKSNKDNRIESITIKQLLTHTSGITRDGDTQHWTTFSFPSPTHIKKYIQTLKLPYEPNSRWKYSNLGFSILGMVIEQVSSQSYSSYIAEHIIKPLNLTHTGFNTDPKDLIVPGYSRLSETHKQYAFPEIDANGMTSATGLYSNTKDLLIYISALFTGNNSLISDTSKKLLQTTIWNTENGYTHQALGLRWRRIGTTKVFFHTGGYPGYYTNVTYNPQRQMGIVVLANSLDINTTWYIDLIVNTLLKSKHVKTINPSKYAKYQGMYRSIWSDTIIAQWGNLLIKIDPYSTNPLNDYAILKPISNNRFLLQGSESYEYAGEEVVFKPNKEGKIVSMNYCASIFDKIDL